MRKNLYEELVNYMLEEYKKVEDMFDNIEEYIMDCYVNEIMIEELDLNLEEIKYVRERWFEIIDSVIDKGLVG